MSTTKNDIIVLALDLIRAKTYSSFSYDDIARELNITKAAIHYHFKTKEDLGLAVCQSILDAITMHREEQVAAVAKGKHPWFIIEERVRAQALCGICPMVSLYSDYESLPDSIRQALTRLAEAEIEYICMLVKAYRAKANPDAVLTLMLALKGALQYRRVMGDKFFEKMVKCIKEQFYQMVPKRADA